MTAPNKVKWNHAPVDRSGINAYVHLIRAKDDPPRKPRPKGGQEDKQPHITFNKKPPEHWAEIILAHLQDGVPRTFNRIGVELWDKTADVISSSRSVDDALWLLVERGDVEHTMRAPILFRKRKK